MSSTKKFTLKNVEDAIQRFKTDDLKAHVMPVFPEFQWSEIRDYAIKERLVLNKNAISKILSKMFGQLAPGDNDIKMRVCSLKLIEVSTYPSRRTWSAFKLHGTEEGVLVDADQEALDVALGRALRMSEISGMRQITVHDGMFWIMILPTKRTKTTRVLQLQPPSFFAYAPGCPYLFTPPKRGGGQMAHVDALKLALGYGSVKPLKLEGPDLRGLLQMLKCQEDKCAGNSLHPMQLNLPELQPPEVTVDCGDITISERNARISYAEEIFGANPPALKTLTIHAQNLTPPDELWGSEPIDVKITFTGTNVFETIKDLTASGIIKTPYPAYMHKVLEKGKNTMKLQAINAQSRN